MDDAAMQLALELKKIVGWPTDRVLREQRELGRIARLRYPDTTDKSLALAQRKLLVKLFDSLSGIITFGDYSVSAEALRGACKELFGMRRNSHDSALRRRKKAIDILGLSLSVRNWRGNPGGPELDLMLQFAELLEAQDGNAPKLCTMLQIDIIYSFEGTALTDVEYHIRARAGPDSTSKGTAFIALRGVEVGVVQKNIVGCLRFIYHHAHGFSSLFVEIQIPPPNTEFIFAFRREWTVPIARQWPIAECPALPTSPARQTLRIKNLPEDAYGWTYGPLRSLASIRVPPQASMRPAVKGELFDTFDPPSDGHRGLAWVWPKGYGVARE